MRSLQPQAAPPTTAAERFRAHQAARDLIERLAARQPLLLLVLDDVHWCDGASVELLSHLARRPPDAAVMVVIATRPGQLPPALALGDAVEIELPPLRPQDAALLVGDRAEALYEASGGNPFYLLALARFEGADVPPTVAATIAAELEGLPEETRTFARAAAVAGDPFDLDLATEVTSLDTDASLQALDDLVARDLVRPEPLPRRFRFRHPLVRNAIYAGSPPGVRLMAHERAAAALEAQGASATERAHMSRSPPGAATPAPWRSCARPAWTLRNGRRRARPAGSRRRCGSCRLGAASRARAAARRARACVGGHRAAGGGPASLLEAMGDGDVDVELVSACARIELLLGRLDDGRARLEEALAHSAKGAGRLWMDLALNAFYGADIDRMRAAAQQALGAGEEAGGFAALAMAGSGAGPIPEAQAHCTRAAELIDAMSDGDAARSLDALTHLCGAEYCLDRSTRRSGTPAAASRSAATSCSRGWRRRLPPHSSRRGACTRPAT
jgi:hypothetical protein